MLMLDVSSGDILPMIVLMPSKPREAKKVVMKTLVRNVVFCSWLIVPAGVKSITEKISNISEINERQGFKSESFSYENHYSSNSLLSLSVMVLSCSWDWNSWYVGRQKELSVAWLLTTSTLSVSNLVQPTRFTFRIKNLQSRKSQKKLKNKVEDRFEYFLN